MMTEPEDRIPERYYRKKLFRDMKPFNPFKWAMIGLFFIGIWGVLSIFGIDLTQLDQSYITIKCWNETTFYYYDEYTLHSFGEKEQRVCEDYINGLSPEHLSKKYGVIILNNSYTGCAIEYYKFCCECLASSCKEEEVIQIRGYYRKYYYSTEIEETTHDTGWRDWIENTDPLLMCNPRLIGVDLIDGWEMSYECDTRIETKQSCTECRNSITKEEINCGDLTKPREMRLYDV